MICVKRCGLINLYILTHPLSRALTRPRPPRPRPRTIIPEWIISLPHSLAETSLSRPCYEVVAFLGVASDAVEERAERAAGREAHVFDGLVAEQFEHDELAGR